MINFRRTLSAGILLLILQPIAHGEIIIAEGETFTPHALEIHSRQDPTPASGQMNAPHQASKNTLHDVKIM